MKRSHQLLCASLLVVLAAFSPLMVQLGTNAAMGLRFLVATLIILRWLPTVRVTKRSSRIVSWAFAYCLLALVSTLWSAMPMVSLLAAGDLWLVTLAAVSLGTGLSPDAVVRAAALAGIAIIVATLVVMVQAPQTQLDEYGLPSRTGIFTNPNELGRQMVITAVMCAAMVAHRRRYLLPLLVAVVIAISTESAQVIIVGITACLAFFATRTLRESRRARGTLTFLTVAAAALSMYLAFSSRETVFSALGKDSTITYRIPIWQAVMRTLEGRWITGYGFGQYWRDPWVVSEMSGASTQAAQQAHNSALELAAQVGIIGVIIVGFLVVKALLVGYRSLDTSPAGSSALVTLTVALATYSITASLFGRTPEQYYWVLLIALTTSLSTSAARATEAPSDPGATAPEPSTSARAPVQARNARRAAVSAR